MGASFDCSLALALRMRNVLIPKKLPHPEQRRGEAEARVEGRTFVTQQI
jgi:hypothetical protein